MSSLSATETFYNPLSLRVVCGNPGPRVMTAHESDMIAYAMTGDIPAMTAIYHGFKQPYDPHITEYYENCMKNPHRAFLKSMRNGVMNGYLGFKTFEKERSDFAQITSLYVANKREGIGTNLVDAFIQFAHTLNVKTVGGRPALNAVGFYKALRFTINDFNYATKDVAFHMGHRKKLLV